GGHAAGIVALALRCVSPPDHRAGGYPACSRLRKRQDARKPVQGTAAGAEAVSGDIERSAGGRQRALRTGSPVSAVPRFRVAEPRVNESLDGGPDAWRTVLPR